MGEDQGLSLPSSETSTPAVSIRGVRRSFGDVHALGGVDLDVAQGEFVSILGPSGCGKTTLLRIIGGFEFADAGEVMVAGRNITNLPPHKRPVNTVFQRYALFPHKTVGENIGFALSIKRRKKAEISERVEEMLRLVRLEGYADRAPSKLSGGQAQRVALARALVNHPKVLLLDEPLAALDLKLRQAMHFELRRIQRAVGSTFIYVTHDQEEALTMSDRIVLMNGGLIEQIGSPTEVYRRPRSRFVSEFIGEVNLLTGHVTSSRQEPDGMAEVEVQIGTDSAFARNNELIPASASVSIGIRPEQMRIVAAGSPHEPDVNRLSGVMESSVFLGAFTRHIVSLSNGANLMIQAGAEAAGIDLEPGTGVVVEWGRDAGVLLCE